MTTLESPPAALGAPLTDELEQLELRIARRADQIAAAHGGLPGRDLVTWLEAEAEIFARQAEERGMGLPRVAPPGT